MKSSRRPSATSGPRRFTTCTAPEIIAKLKSRRDLLPDLAGKYADVLAEDCGSARHQEEREIHSGAPAQRQHPRGDAQNQQRGQAHQNPLRPVLDDRRDRRAAPLRHQRARTCTTCAAMCSKGVKLRIIAGTGRDCITTATTWPACCTKPRCTTPTPATSSTPAPKPACAWSPAWT